LLRAEPGGGKIWKHLPLVLALALAARAAVALSGDFSLHPDEIFQYLEPAHRLVFGTGVTYWEYFYGARSWIVPGLVAGVLKLCDMAGLSEPWWYVGGVELVFCVLSLTIPAGMYFAAREHFGETSARVALVAGAFFYELCGFAHKPMTEFVATGPLLLVLWIAVRRTPVGLRAGLAATVLTVLATGVRMQYAPLAALLFGIVVLRAKHRVVLVLAAAGMALAVGAFDAAVWGGGLFHSYVTNVRFNLAIADARAGESAPWQYVAWLVTAHGGLSAASVLAAMFAPKRYALLLLLVALVVGIHSMQSHKEYRFVFVAVPLLLMIGADLVARLHRGGAWGRAGAIVGCSAAACVSACGILNALPGQEGVYKAWSRETGIVTFFDVRRQDPHFAAYRWLARAPGVGAVWQAERPYYNTPGYYHLHRDIPLYDVYTGGQLAANPALAFGLVTHIVTERRDARFPGFSEDRRFGTVRILARGTGGPVPRWRAHVPVIVPDSQDRLMRRIVPDARVPPANAGIRFE